MTDARIGSFTVQSEMPYIARLDATTQRWSMDSAVRMTSRNKLDTIDLTMSLTLHF